MGFLRRGVIAACLKQAGKQPSLKERFASSAINSAKTAAHDLTKDGGTKNRLTMTLGEPSVGYGEPQLR